MTENSIIPDEEIEVAFKNTNFGDVDHRKLLEASVLKAAMGLSCGYTITQIMKRMGLISRTERAVLSRGKICCAKHTAIL